LWGVFTVKAFVWNPQNPEKRVSVELVVNSGATYTTLPTSLLASLGIKPVRSIRVRLADNRVVERLVGEVGIEVEIEYAITLCYIHGCVEGFRQREPKTLEMVMTKIQEIARNVFNELKTRFEAVVKQLYGKL